ncbi:MAG: ABC transporter permease, partial [Henriciella sp.]|uniref:ABC transporter permease n=1 Tax=Henriciella sp. TaxID=1968823 RepID=UPI003C71C629
MKETLALLRDPKGRVTLFAPVLIQLLIFSFAATLEVKNADIGILDRSHGAFSEEIMIRLAASENFDEIIRLPSNGALTEAIDTQKIIAAIVIEQDFDAEILRGEPAQLGVILDGRRANAAQVVAGYISAISIEAGLGDAASITERNGSVIVNWFNPNLDFLWFNIPALAAIIISVSALSITAQSVARERELGTFDQLMVSPLRVWEILIGKMLPPFILSIINGSVFIIAAPIFGVPFTGSLILFYFGLSLYALSL